MGLARSAAAFLLLLVRLDIVPGETRTADSSSTGTADPSLTVVADPAKDLLLGEEAGAADLPTVLPSGFFADATLLPRDSLMTLVDGRADSS